MKKIGDILKTERERRGLSLHEIGMSLKINPKILKAIEDGEAAQLPAKTFLRGFVRSYAQYLRLDVDQILKIFQEDIGSTRPEEVKTSQASPAAISSEKNSAGTATAVPTRPERSRAAEDASIQSLSSGNRTYTIVGAIVLLMLIVFVVKMIEKYQKESEVGKLENTTPIEKISTTLLLQTSTLLPRDNQGLMSSSSTSSTTILPGVGAVPSSTMTAVTSTTFAPPTTVFVRPTTTTTYVRPTTTTLYVKPTTTTLEVKTTTTLAAKVVTSSSATTSTTIPKKTTEVIVEALSKVQIRYSFDDDTWQDLELAPEEIHTFKSTSEVHLEVNDGGAISVIVNGRDRGVPGSIGKSIKLKY